MRQAFGVLFATLAIAAGATASPVAAHTSHVDCKAGYYKNVSGTCVKRPTAAPKAPAGATARCRDKTYSFSQHASGTCSHHGGVAVWIHHP
jgi:uncharacterized protein DUF3761